MTTENTAATPAQELPIENIALEPVTSSLIQAMGYNPQTETLAVKFNNGPVYQYRAVPGYVWADLKGAESIGRFFLRSIKNQYPTVRVPMVEDGPAENAQA